MDRVEVIDSHTGGEPTRVVLSGAPNLGKGSLAQRAERFRRDFDLFRSAIVNEPRGSDVHVGALLCEPHDDSCSFGVLFFNNVGTIGMCGHGTIGLITTLAHQNRITPGAYRIDTPVGPVSAILHADGRVTVRNVPSYRFQKNVSVHVPALGTVEGDIAWGGNWFFLISNHNESLKIQNVEHLTSITWQIRQALELHRITGSDGSLIDHVELFGPPLDRTNHSRNFVLCPGKAYDRSPCGTGTSAKLACLIADGKISLSEIWRQESITGSVFEARAEANAEPNTIIPSITGTAYITAESTLLFDPRDPLRNGIRDQ